MNSLLFSLLLNLLLKLLILVSVPHLRWNYLSLLLNSSSAAIVSLPLVAWLLMRLVGLPHHVMVLLLFLTILVNLLFVLFILLVTDIAMGIIISLLEIGCLALVLGRLRVHWVTTALDFRAFDAELAGVDDGHTISC